MAGDRRRRDSWPRKTDFRRKTKMIRSINRKGREVRVMIPRSIEGMYTKRSRSFNGRGGTEAKVAVTQ